jgi:hypothetical protein
MSGLREPEMEAVFLDLLNTPQLRVRRIRRNVELSPTVNQPPFLLFTNPSVGHECYRLLALEDLLRVYVLIIESAHALNSQQ